MRFPRLPGLLGLLGLLGYWTVTVAWGKESITVNGFEVDDVKKFSIMADKAYHRTGDKVFEAVGNVIIIREAETIYGESGRVDLAKGEISIDGNVRLTSKHLSMYGSKIFFQFYNQFLQIFDAQVIAESFTLHGKHIEWRMPNRISARNAQYTTCRDCPESWSVYGEHVEVVLGEYVTIKGASIKVGGVPMIYLPYVIFPIKRRRTSGLLFPQVSTSSKRSGVTLKFPLFWAISDAQDMTFSPAVFGDSEVGGELEYRSVFGQEKWLWANAVDVWDEQYGFDSGRDGLEKGEGSNRYFTHYEHKFRWGNYGNHHLVFSAAGDKDMVRDFDSETKDFYHGNELGVGGFSEFKNDLVQVYLEGYYMDNLLADDPREFDHHLVQVLPRVGFAVTPFNILKTNSFINSITIGTSGDMTNFKQNHSTDITEGVANSPVRNAQRFNSLSYMDIELGHRGPFRLRSRWNFDYQYYSLPELPGHARKFSKQATLLQNELSLEMAKVYGLSYQVEIPRSQVEAQPSAKKSTISDEIIGELPYFEGALVEDHITIKSNSYRHSQEWKLIHYKLLDSSHSGDIAFGKQLQTNLGGFDIVDAFRHKELEVSAEQNPGKLSRENIVELQWNNNLLRKSPVRGGYSRDGIYQRNFFNYNKVFGFNLSQGFDLSKDDGGQSFREKLDRLALVTKLSISDLAVTGKGYYFYNGEHIYELNFSSWGKIFDYSLGFLHNSVDQDTASNNLKLAFKFKPTDTWAFKGDYIFDIDSKVSNNIQSYQVVYSPSSNCWQLELGFIGDSSQTRMRVNFSVFFDSKLGEII